MLYKIIFKLLKEQLIWNLVLNFQTLAMKTEYFINFQLQHFQTFVLNYKSLKKVVPMWLCRYLT